MTTGLVMLFSASIAQKSLEKLAKRLFLSEAERPSKPGRATAKIVKWGESLAIVSFHIQGPLARPGISTSVCFPEPYLSTWNIPAPNGGGRDRRWQKEGGCAPGHTGCAQGETEQGDSKSRSEERRVGKERRSRDWP